MQIKVTPKTGAGYFPYGEYDGFTKLAEIEWRNNAYEFDITGVWKRDSDNTLWIADDSGCSCPSPWESTWELERLFNFEPILERRKDRATYGGDQVVPQEWESFKATVEAALAALAGS